MAWFNKPFKHLPDLTIMWIILLKSVQLFMLKVEDIFLKLMALNRKFNF